MAKFIVENWRWILSVVVIASVNYGMLKSELDNKIDREEARRIIKEEIIQQTFSKVDGEVLKEKLNNICEKVDVIYKILVK